VRLEWDEAQILSNRRKRGVSFEQACTVFRDPLYVSVLDRVEDGERRWLTLGVARVGLVGCGHTVREERDHGTSVEVIRIISVRQATRKERRVMKMKMVSYTSESLPALTKAERTRLNSLAARPDSEIDTSDIPEMTDEQWKYARRGHFCRPRKRQITARVDADVLDWLKSQGKGYQSRINAILRREMLTSVKSGR